MSVFVPANKVIAINGLTSADYVVFGKTKSFNKNIHKETALKGDGDICGYCKIISKDANTGLCRVPDSDRPNSDDGVFRGNAGRDFSRIIN